MTIRKAKRLIEDLTKSIERFEDDAVLAWSKPETLGQELVNEEFARQLSAKYTCRRALKSWLTRHTR